MTNKLILWDVDGTLLYSGGVAGECMRMAMQQVYGSFSTEERHQYAGKTDTQIIFETFASQAPEQLLSQLELFTASYLRILEEQRGAFLARGYVLPGVPDVLAALHTRPVIQSALTGNLASVAHFKLDLTELLPYFDLDAGAYGSDHHERKRLPAIAAERAQQRYGRSFRGSDVVVIGDTPFDIACGKAFGARTVAVATGPFSVEQLQEHEPDAVLPDLQDLQASVAAILE